MKNYSPDNLVNFITAFALIMLTSVLYSSAIFKYVYLIYSIQFLVSIYIGYVFHDKAKFFISPAFIFILYTNISFIAGSLLFSIGLDYNDSQIIYYFGLTHIKAITIVYILGNSIVLFSYKPIPEYENKTPILNDDEGKKNLIVGVLGLILFSSFNLDLSFLGGGGDFSLYPQVLFLIIIFHYLAKKRIGIRYIIYLLLIGFFASSHYDSKREALSLFFSILFFEIFFKNINIFKSLSKTILIVTGIGFLVFFMIISMSITRGYGSFGVSSYSQSFEHIPEYIQSDYFSDVIIANTEVTMAYFHSVDAINYVLDDMNQIKFGSTFSKVLFIPVPRSVFPNKPESAIHWYTKLSDPLYSLRGGSSPINLVSEFFLNFHFLFFIPLYIMFFYFNKLFFLIYDQLSSGKNLNAILLLYGYTFLLAFYRGSGFDLYVLAIILMLPIFLVLKFLIKFN